MLLRHFESNHADANYPYHGAVHWITPRKVRAKTMVRDKDRTTLRD